MDSALNGYCGAADNANDQEGGNVNGAVVGADNANGHAGWAPDAGSHVGSFQGFWMAIGSFWI